MAEAKTGSLIDPSTDQLSMDVDGLPSHLLVKYSCYNNSLKPCNLQNSPPNPDSKQESEETNGSQ